MRILKMKLKKNVSKNFSKIVTLIFLTFSFSGNIFENSAVAAENMVVSNKNVVNTTNIPKEEVNKNNNSLSNNAKRSSKSSRKARMTLKMKRGIYDVMWAIKMVESHGNYKAKSRWSSASGAYQFIDSTWNNYGGYKRAYLAPAKIQDQRMFRSLEQRFWDKDGDWEKVIAAHMYPAWSDDKSKWHRSPGNGNPSLWEYVNKVMSKAKL